MITIIITLNTIFLNVNNLCKVCNEKHNDKQQIINLTIKIKTIIQKDIDSNIQNRNHPLLKYTKKKTIIINQINEIDQLKYSN